MRELVYRVQPLPKSLLPYVWDFGQLRPDVEFLYIRQIVRRYITNIFAAITQAQAQAQVQLAQTGPSSTLSSIAPTPSIQAQPESDEESDTESHDTPVHSGLGMIDSISDVLHTCQKFMRAQVGECSFVSLRDVDRSMQVFEWFVVHAPHLFRRLDRVMREKNQKMHMMKRFARALLLSVSVCYYASLQESREKFREEICAVFRKHDSFVGFRLNPERLLQEIDTCQDVFLNECSIGPNIARNRALKENVMMMVICIDLRIPLFLVGQPGSSKSLAKTIVEHALQGTDSTSMLFKHLKKARLHSFQCSPLATADGIINAFKQAARYQTKQDTRQFVSVVVLDGVDLAEMSINQPLKTLHSLMEEGVPDEKEGSLGIYVGSTSNESILYPRKVGLIGISNCALGPAKFNRGILVQVYYSFTECHDEPVLTFISLS